MAFRPRKGSRFEVAAVEVLPDVARQVEARISTEAWEGERPSLSAMLRRLVDRGLAVSSAPDQHRE